MMPNRIFISHHSRDKKTADSVCYMLESDSHNCWIAPRNIPENQPWAQAINSAIKDADALVLLLSNNSISSAQVIREIEIAAKHNISIIPISIEDIHLEGAMRYYLGACDILKLTDTSEVTLKKLCNQLSKKLR